MPLKSISGPDSPLYTLSQGLKGASTCLFIPTKPVLWPGTMPTSTLPGDFQGVLTWEPSLPLLFLSCLKARHHDCVSVSFLHSLSILSLFLHCYPFPPGSYHPSLTWPPAPVERFCPLCPVLLRDEFPFVMIISSSSTTQQDSPL